MPHHHVDSCQDHFKRCPLCSREWKSLEEFLSDPELQLNGYQFTGLHFRNSSNGGMLLFTHRREECGTTLAVYAQMLKELLQNETRRTVPMPV